MSITFLVNYLLKRLKMHNKAEIKGYYYKYENISKSLS